MFKVNIWCHVNVCPVTAETAAFMFSGVCIDLSGCQDFVFCICLEVEGPSYRNSVFADAESLSGHPSYSLIS